MEPIDVNQRDFVVGLDPEYQWQVEKLAEMFYQRYIG